MNSSRSGSVDTNDGDAVSAKSSRSSSQRSKNASISHNSIRSNASSSHQTSRSNASYSRSNNSASTAASNRPQPPVVLPSDINTTGTSNDSAKFQYHHRDSEDTTESFHTRTTSSYLAFFRSPRARNTLYHKQQQQQIQDELFPCNSAPQLHTLDENGQHHHHNASSSSAASNPMMMNSYSGFPTGFENSKTHDSSSKQSNDISTHSRQEHDSDDDHDSDEESRKYVPTQYLTNNNNNEPPRLLTTASSGSSGRTADGSHSSRLRLGTAASVRRHTLEALSSPSSILTDDEDDFDDSRSDNGLSILSSHSNLFGEQVMHRDEQVDENVEVVGLEPLAPPAESPSSSSNSPGSPASVSIATASRRHGWTTDWKDNVSTVVRGVGHDLWRPLLLHRQQQEQLSPRSRNLSNLHYLTQRNQRKLQLVDPYGTCSTDNNNNHHHALNNETTTTKRNETVDQFFDFCLILQPQETYAYWASLLDFRRELLGEEVVDQMDRSTTSSGSSVSTRSETLSDRNNNNNQQQQPGGSDSWSSSSSPCSPNNNNEDDDNNNNMNNSSHASHSSEARDQLGDIHATPSTSLRRRKQQPSSALKSSNYKRTPQQPQYQQQQPISLFTPARLLNTGENTSVADSSRQSLAAMSRLSMFERATLGSNNNNNNSDQVTPDDDTLNQSRMSTWTTSHHKTQQILPNGEYETTPNVRRRWGNHHASVQAGFMSPPIRSLTRGGSTATASRLPLLKNRISGSTMGTNNNNNNEQVKKSSNSNEITVEEIPNEPIPRGMVARTHYLSVFLSELHRGIVVRRHRPDKTPVFVKLVSTDGGDTIQHLHVTPEEAHVAFLEQRMRYNQKNRHDVLRSASWATGEHHDSDNPRDHHTTQIATSALSKQEIAKNVKKIVASKVHRLANAKIENLIVVHPSTHQDPRHSDYYGTIPLRQSNTTYAPDHTFSLVYANTGTPNLLRGSTTGSSGGGCASGAGHHQPVAVEKMQEAEQRWYEGAGNESSFKYFDFEAATIGEYWLLLRGFLLLRRDAAVGRFAEHRAAGIGSHYSRLEREQRTNYTANSSAVSGKKDPRDNNNNNSDDDPNRLHRDEFHEPVTVGCLEKLFVKWRKLDTTYMEGYTLEGAVPPPSDYFLGFKAPGTSIWSRLRLAGLRTERVYSLDPRRVLIKVSCPSDRLMDVAEVLRLKLPTRGAGNFAPFREDDIDLFQSQNDPSETPFIDDPRSFHFRSSIRQSLIDFIISSRIRDSGAELGHNTDVGKLIQARVPLHMRRKVDAVYNVWAFFWRASNWQGRDGCSLSHEFHNTENNNSHTHGCKISNGSADDIDDDDSESKAVLEPPHRLIRVFKGCFYLPLDSIEEYFGEKIAFYFAWLQHTAFHLVWLALAGLIMFCIQVSNESLDHPLQPFYAILVMIWTFLVLINWKKRANFLAYRWGTLDYKEQETTRPEFQGDYARDEITGEWVVTYPKWKRWIKYSISFPITLFFTAGTLVLILCVHANRDSNLAAYLDHKNNNATAEEFKFEWSLEAITTERQFTKMELRRENFTDPRFWLILIGMPAALGLCQPLLNLILMRLSVGLNNFENYRTVSEYRTHLIIKVIAFRFVCYFAHLYYYAFSSFGGDDAIQNGMLRVSTGVAVYTTVAHWWQAFLAIEFPILIRKIRMYYRKKRLCEELREIELEEERIAELASRGVDDDLKARQIQQINKRLLLEQAQDDIWLEVMLPEHNSFAEYIQAVVLFTYVACFSAVLPITPLIVLFNYLVSMRLDAFKVCKGRRRPLAEKTGGIGVWEHLLHIVAVISVLTNCWLMGFTNSMFTSIRDDANIGEVGLFAIIVGWEHIMLLIKYVMETSISTLPRNVKDAIKKEQHDVEMQRNTSMRLRQGRRTQHERESLPAEDRTRGVWRNVPSIRLGRTVDEQESTTSASFYAESQMCRAPIPDSDLESIGDESASAYKLQTPRVGRSDKDQGIRTLFSA